MGPLTLIKVSSMMCGAQKNAEEDVDSVYDQGTQSLSPVSCG